MFTKKKYTFGDVIRWTRWEIIRFLAYATVVAILFHVVGWHWLRLPWTPIALIGTAVAFLITFQNNAAYGRIWEARKIWGGIVNYSRSWGMLIGDMVTNEHADTPMQPAELDEQKRILTYRHIAWMTALRHAMRQRKSWEVFQEHRTNREWSEKIFVPEYEYTLEQELQPLLTSEELQTVLQKSNPAAVILTLQSRHIRMLKESGYIWEFSFLSLEQVLVELFNLQGKSERIKNFPYPRQYASLSYDFVRLFVLLLPFGVIPEFANVGETLVNEYPLIGKDFVWVAVPFSAAISWVFATMQRIGTVGENPFEGTSNDVPISTISRGIETDLREMLDEDPEMIPEPWPACSGVQM